jgi:integrase
MLIKVKLTAAAVDRYVRDGLEREVADTECPGLMLRVRGANVASYSHRYFLKGGPHRRYTIGVAGDVPGAVSLKEARVKLHELRTKISSGIDPVAEEKAEAAAKRAAEVAAAEEARKADQRITVGAAIDRYIADRTAASAKKGKGAPRERIRTLSVDVGGALGEKKLVEVTDDDIMAIIDAAKDEGYERKPSKVFDECRSFLNWAAARKLITASPLKSPRPEQNGARERVLATHELRAFLASLPMTKMPKSVQDICELVLRLGQRAGEVAGMRHTEVNLADDVWVIGKRRAKNSERHRVPLPPAAHKIIATAMQRSQGQQWVFPNRDGTGPIHVTTVGGFLIKARSVFGFLDDDNEPHPFISHDLRRTCATCLEKLGTPERTIGAVLNHKWTKNKTVTGKVYTHADYFEAAYDALVKWEFALEHIAAGVDPFKVSVADRRKRAEAIRLEMAATALLPAPEAASSTAAPG